LTHRGPVPLVRGEAGARRVPNDSRAAYPADRPVLCSWNLPDRDASVEVCWDPSHTSAAVADGNRMGYIVGRISRSMPRRIRVEGLIPYEQSLSDTDQVIGIYRPAQGPGFHCSPAELEALMSVKPYPPALVLLTRVAEASTVAGFLLWDEAGIEQESRMLLTLGRKARKLSAPAPPRGGVRETPTPSWILSGLSLLLAVVAITIVFLRTTGKFPSLTSPLAKLASSSEAGEGVSLSAAFLDGKLRVFWNAAAPVLRGAQRAALVIQEGETIHALPLDGDTLRNGGAWYTPEASDLVVRLTASAGNREFSESLRVLTNGVPIAPSSSGTAADAQKASPAAMTMVTVEQPRLLERKIEYRPLIVQPGRQSVLEAPNIDPLAEAGIPSASGPVVGSRFITASPPPAPVEQKRSPEPPVRAVEFIPPVPRVKAPIPSVVAYQKNLTRDLNIEVALVIDSSGKVVSTTTARQSEVYAAALARVAENTAKQWEFEPARRYGSPVQGSYTLVFQFKRR